MMRITIRADASPEMGSGHLMRCLTLADELAGSGAAVTFLLRRSAGPLLDTLRARGHGVAVLEAPGWGQTQGSDPIARPHGSDPIAETLDHASWLPVSMQEDAEQTAAVLADLGGVDWLVVDHYALDERWERRQRPHARRILAIDDLADRRHDCDVLLDQNLVDGLATRYDGLVPAGCRKLLGPAYALLRREFRAARRNLRRRDGTVGRILVFLGGADPTNETAKALAAIALIGRPDIAVDVVLGAMSPHIEAVRERVAALVAAGQREAHLHVQVSNMAELMAAADLAIGAGGSATWERCCLGLPTLTLEVAPNQRAGLAALGAEPAAIHLGRAATATAADLAAGLALLLRSPTLVKALSRRALDIADGEGASRVLRALGASEQAISVRPATAADADRLLAWRNHPATRAASLHSHEITIAEHRAWLACALADPDHIILIGETAGEAVGVLRYAVAADTARISIALSPEQQGRGLGVPLLKAGEAWLSLRRPGIRRLQADVLAHNEASHRIFRAAGFSCEHMTYTRTLAA